MADTLPDELTNPPPNGLILIGRDQWDWLTKGIRLTYLAAHQPRPAQDAVLKALETMNKVLEHLVMTTSDFQGSLDRNTAATNAAGQAITAEIAQLKAAIDALSTSQPPTQAQLDQLNASSDALEAATASLVSDDPAAPPEG